MNDKEILEKAIQKAIDGGWKEGMVDWNKYFSVGGNPKELIFNHDFAKALWGNDKCDWNVSNSPELLLNREWQLHLAKMVIAEDPIKYLRENI